MYQLTKNNFVLRLSDSATIPRDPENADYQAVLAWIEGGNTLQEAPPEPPTPILAVTMRQARLALLAAGRLSQIDAAIESLPSPQKEAARIEWGYSQEVQRHKPLVLALALALGLDEAALDALFLTASQL